MPFVSIDLTVDPDQLQDDAIDAVNTTLTANSFPGWTANDATLAVILLGTIAQLFAELGNIATTVVPAVWRAYGTQILGVPYQNGTTATVLSTWTFTSPSPSGGYTIPAGTTVIIDGSAFFTQTDYTSNTGDTTAVITLVASQAGSAYNNLGGVNAPAELNDQIDWVASVTTQGVTSGGQDQETDPDYQNRLVDAAQLQAPRPVVDADFAQFVQTDIAENATGVSVGRATSIDMYYPDGRALSTGGAGSTVLTCTLTNTSKLVTYAGSGDQAPEVGATVTGTGVPGGTTVAASPAPTESTFSLSANATTSGSESLTISALSGYGPVHLTCAGTLTNTSTSVTIVTAPYLGAVPDVGARVTGTGVPAGATVASSPAPTTSGFTLSAAATANETDETLTISSWTSVSLADCVFVTDANGDALSDADMDALETWLETYRPQNWLVNVEAPTYTEIYVSPTIHVLPSADPTSVVANVQAAVVLALSPQTWGNTLATQTGAGSWLNSTQGFNIVRQYSLIGVVESVPGVAYCTVLDLGTSPSPGGTSNITLSGPAPLPMCATGNVVVATV